MGRPALKLFPFLLPALGLLVLPAAADQPSPTTQRAIGAGWTEEFPDMNFDLPPHTTDRHTVTDGVDHFYVLDSDPSTFPGRDSGCRAEARVYNDYSSGQRQFAADLLIEPGTNNVSVFQIFGNTGHATTCMIWATRNGCLSHYGGEVLATDIYNRWIHLNVIHDVDSGVIEIYIDGKLTATYHDSGPHKHYFKFGVYRQRNMGERSGVFYKNVHFYAKEPRATSAPATTTQPSR
jgi:hypothetical protein